MRNKGNVLPTVIANLTMFALVIIGNIILNSRVVTDVGIKLYAKEVHHLQCLMIENFNSTVMMWTQQVLNLYILLVLLIQSIGKPCKEDVKLMKIAEIEVE